MQHHSDGTVWWMATGRISTSRLVRMHQLVDSIDARRKLLSRCIPRAREKGNHGAAAYWSTWCLKADNLASLVRFRMTQQRGDHV